MFTMPSTFTLRRVWRKKETAAFDKNVRMNAQYYGRLLVCLRCQDIGLSPKDCTTYKCAGNSSSQSGHDVGHLRLPCKPSKLPKGPWRCTMCRSIEEDQATRGQKRKASDQENNEQTENARIRQLLRTLRSKESLRCTCKHTRPATGERARSALEGKAHDEKCQLQRTMAGEKLWDGKNLGVTLADLKLLADRKKY